MTATAFAALVVILLGWLLRRLGVLSPAAGPALVKIVIYLTLPALVFHIMITREMEWSLALVPLVGFAVHGVLVAIAWGLARARKLDPKATGALILPAHPTPDPWPARGSGGLGMIWKRNATKAALCHAAASAARVRTNDVASART